jgi:hypothetical protein
MDFGGIIRFSKSHDEFSLATLSARLRFIPMRYTPAIGPEEWRRDNWTMVSVDTLVWVKAVGGVVA